MRSMCERFNETAWGLCATKGKDSRINSPGSHRTPLTVFPCFGDRLVFIFYLFFRLDCTKFKTNIQCIFLFLYRGPKKLPLPCNNTINVDDRLKITLNRIKNHMNWLYQVFCFWIIMVFFSWVYWTTLLGRKSLITRKGRLSFYSVFFIAIDSRF